MPVVLRRLLLLAGCLVGCDVGGDPPSTPGEERYIDPRFLRDGGRVPDGGALDADGGGLLPDGAQPTHPDDAALDASDDDAGATDGSAPGDCLNVPIGKEVRIEGKLELGSPRWSRIDAQQGCPAKLVTGLEVAYQPYGLCASDQPRRLEVVMEGLDRLETDLRITLGDPLLVVYPTEAEAQDDPFQCLAANDDGTFGGVPSTSSRIGSLVLDANTSAVILASSATEPVQNGLGIYVLTVSAEAP